MINKIVWYSWRKRRKKNEIYFNFSIVAFCVNLFSWIVEALRDSTISYSPICLSRSCCACTTSIDSENRCGTSKSLLSVDSLLYLTASKTAKIRVVPKVTYNLCSNNAVGLPTILFVLGDKMGEAICTVIGLLLVFGSISIFMSLITDKHYYHPVKHSAVDNDLADVMIVDEVFNQDDVEIDDDLLE